MVDRLINKLNQLYPLPPAISDYIKNLAKEFFIPAGQFLLREGQVCDKACYIAEGCTRSFYLNEGEEITSRFMMTGDIVTSWISYYTQKPGMEYIQTVEDTHFVALSYQDIQSLYIQFPEFNAVARRQVEYAFYQSELRTQLLRKHTAEEKYDLFLQRHPGLMQKVPLKHIASYLGMSHETLSRVRSKYHRKY